MTLTVLLFGPQASLADAREVTVRFDGESATAGQVLAAIGAAAPRLSASLASSRLAVNQEFVAEGHAIAAGDEIALIGMVSGG